MTATSSTANYPGAPPPDPARSGPARFPAFFRAALSEYSILFLSILYFLCVWPFVPGLAAADNLANLFVSMLPLLVLAIGQTIVLIAGGIDLSVTGIIAATSIAAATIASDASGLLARHPAATAAAVLVALSLGVIIGLLNGTAITLLRMPPFIVTLSMMMCVSGATLWSVHSRNIAALPDSFTNISYGRTFGIPNPLLIVLILAALTHLLLAHTLPGRWLFAVGHNPRTSLVSGVPFRGVTILAYALSGLCAAVASILLTARLETGSPTQGDKMLLDVIGATVIGGTSLAGGRGKVIWTFFGVLLFSLISNTLQLLNLQHFTIMIVKGAVILLAAALDVLRTRLLAGRRTP
jgi:ribose/xylose/arabinose/galactoside ABC-type transport system permease subunit